MKTKKNDSPLTLASLRKKKTVKATKKLPQVITSFERIWKPRLKSAGSNAELVHKQNYSVVEHTVQSLKRIAPPAIKSQKLTKGTVEKYLTNEKLSNGTLHKFLDLKFLPKLSQKIQPVKIRKGEDKPVNVFGIDTRYIFDDSSFPWCTTGRVETELGIGTGTMIGKNLMLTCSHVIKWNDDGSCGWIKFSPSYYNGAHPYFGTSWGTRVVFWNKASGGLSDFETAFDYVVVVLDEDMGDKTGYPGYRTYASSWNDGSYWQTIGYPGDLTGTQRPAFFGNGAISSVSSESTSGQTGYVLGHFMDITPGHSGGPVWGWWDGVEWPRVVGVCSAESGSPAFSTSGDNEFGGGPALSALIGYARDHY